MAVVLLPSDQDEAFPALLVLLRSGCINHLLYYRLFIIITSDSLFSISMLCHDPGAVVGIIHDE